jgi:hypothetical protein
VYPDFRDLLAAFAAHQVRFLIVGAHALAVHGIPRATGDLDASDASVHEAGEPMISPSQVAA